MKTSIFAVIILFYGAKNVSYKNSFTIFNLGFLSMSFINRPSFYIFFFILQGGVILVSHDERLIRMICKELWVCGNGTVTSIDGGFDEYRKIVEKELLEAQAK